MKRHKWWFGGPGEIPVAAHNAVWEWEMLPWYARLWYWLVSSW